MLDPREPRTSGTPQFSSSSRDAPRGGRTGSNKGEVKGLRAAITHVLAARSLALSELGRARLTSCADVAVLTAWLERVATAASEAEVFVGADSV